MADTADREPDVTRLLQKWTESGRPETLDRLISVIHGDLRRVARSRMSRERRDHTLQVTALVNETFLRLVDQRRTDWRNRAHFLAVAASCMRRILVDYARRRNALKRPRVKVPLDDIFTDGVTSIEYVLPVHEALEGLARLDRDQAAIVELRFFSDLNIDEIADLQGVSPSTIKRELRTAKVFLKACLEAGDDDA